MSKLITNTIRHTGGSADNITLDNSQNVTVEGNATVDGTLQVGGDSGVAGTWHLEAYNGSGDGTAIVAGTTGAKIELRDTGSSEQFVLAANGDCNVYSYLNGDNISFHTTDGSGTTNRLKIRSNGDVDLETGDLVVATAGKGIMFHPHAAANKLDDYEEGTFTPRLGGASNIGTYNVTGVGVYVKIGKMVTVQFHFYNKDLDNNADGAVYIDQMPFTSKNGNTVGGISDNFHTEKVDFMEDRRYTWYISGNDTKLKGLYSTDGSGWANWQVADFESSGMYMEVQCSYMTA